LLVAQRNPVSALGGFILLSVMSVFGLSALFFLAIPNCLNANKLAVSSIETTAQVSQVSTYLRGKGTYVEYSYLVNGKWFTGTSDGNYAVGERGPIRIRYLPDNPSYSAVDPDANQVKAQRGVGFMFLWNALVFVFAVLARYSVRKYGVRSGS
jgi:hypothetical protein